MNITEGRRWSRRYRASRHDAQRRLCCCAWSKCSLLTCGFPTRHIGPKRKHLSIFTIYSNMKPWIVVRKDTDV